jgi:methionine salvage enolase-phosphatase E1
VPCSPKYILFISDSSKQLEAAQSAEMFRALAVRSGGGIHSSGASIISSFDEVFPGGSGFRGGEFAAENSAGG